MRGENVVREAGTVSRDQHSSLRRRSSFHVHVAHSSLICVAARPLIPSTARRWRDTREIPMNVTKVLGLAAVGGLLMLAAPAERAEALSLASPGAAAAVQNDSKQVTEINRNELRIFIEQNAIDYSVARVDHKEIDRINILRASFKAMHLAIRQLKVQPQFLLIDGNRFTKYKKIPHQCIIEGDGLYSSIAAASILAKTYRDDYMRQLHEEFPHYHWYSNKGYGTREHSNAIEEFELSKNDRKSFDILPPQLKMELS